MGEVRWAAFLVVLAAVGAGCGNDSTSDDVALPRLLTEEDLGAGWDAVDPGDVALLPGSVAPPCPFEGAIPDVEVIAADSIEFGNEQRLLGVNHTVAGLDGPDTAADVFETWSTMDCSGSDFDQGRIDDVPTGALGIRLTSQSGAFTQAVVVTLEGSSISFLIVSGDGEEPVAIARTLASRT